MTAPPLTAASAAGARPSGRRRPSARTRSFRWRGLRGRATLAFAALALVLSAVTALAVWSTVSSYLLVLREKAVVAQAVANADQLQRGLATQGLTAPQLLSQLPRETGSTSLVVTGGEWSTTSLTTGREALPEELRRVVVAGQPAAQRIEVDGRPRLAVGLPLAGVDAAYFEVFPLDELDSTYRVLSAVLAGAVLALPLGALLLGRWATRPALRPLERVAEAAAAIAAGDLRARIDPCGDPDLEPIAASFNETAAALERRVRSDARFAADVSHELRSPLTTMVTAAALLDGHRSSLPEDGQEALDLLRADLDRFTRLVQDLLEISRADAGSADVVLEDVHLPSLVEHALPAGLRGRLVVAPEAGALVVRADKRRLERVVANLVDNAERHGGGLSAVRVEAGDGEARVCVDDDGPGVAPEERERVLERFARGRGSASTSTCGAGLGLSLVARHVHLLHGRLEVRASPSAGARFVVALPAREVRP
ncbi:cell wall metabolism sensor histidine kinase WalK [Quadrisphaera sp. DSM 44207]|uniref:sensor histidine kinase n=1 Tax=Quadrisphaera sp. DSM 44207 TaxID=1881057 RepID=UPI000883C920|nr:HAMP domain-containing sensor histidine kinase [Quadrisphaera sp. DSM 44207]SDQ63270.1 Signal transduction histidine kinase [Quadrisphaera sp. DSM 44207]